MSITQNRNKSVDAIRSIAIFSVIVIHTTPYRKASAKIGQELDLATLINQLSRFAVPLFFILAGYYFTKQINGTKNVLDTAAKYILRLILVYAFWSAIYLFPFNHNNLYDINLFELSKLIYYNLSNLLKDPIKLIFEGPKSHLWLLPALACSAAIISILIKIKRNKYLVPISIALYIIGLLGKAYKDTYFGFNFNFDLRNGPFFSTIFFLIGHHLCRSDLRHITIRNGAMLFSIGAFLHILEIYSINKIFGTTMAQDYTIGTILFGTGAALIAISGTKLFDRSFISRLGPYILGIYGSHIIFIELLRPIDLNLRDTLIWPFIQPTIVFLLSLSLSIFFEKVRCLTIFELSKQRTFRENSGK